MACVKGRGSYERFFEYKFIPLGVADQESGFGMKLGASSGTGTGTGIGTGMGLVTDPGAEVEIVDVSASVSPASSVGILNALVMPNSICVLVGPGIGVGEEGQVRAQAQSRLQLLAVTFDENEAGYMDLSTDSISGKRKKGARKVQAGHKICKFTFSDGSTQTMLSPLSGQVLEVNTAQLAKNPSLVQTQPFGCGFIAVLLPEDDLIPTLESRGAGAAATAAAHSIPDPSVAGGLGESAEAARGFIFAKSNLKRDCSSLSRVGDCKGNGDGWGASEAEGEVRGLNTSSSSIPCMSVINAIDGKDQAKPAAAGSSSSQTKASTCYAFSQNGGCIRGDRCKFAHVVVSDTGCEVIINEHSTGLVGGKRHKKKLRANGNDGGDRDGGGDGGAGKKEEGLCFLFRTNDCKFGDSCKFVHAILQPEGESGANRE
jgi:hypothetical protein